jgi:hypothetical protein
VRGAAFSPTTSRPASGYGLKTVHRNELFIRRTCNAADG